MKKQQLMLQIVCVLLLALSSCASGKNRQVRRRVRGGRNLAEEASISAGYPPFANFRRVKDKKDNSDSNDKVSTGKQKSSSDEEDLVPELVEGDSTEKGKGDDNDEAEEDEGNKGKYNDEDADDNNDNGYSKGKDKADDEEEELSIVEEESKGTDKGADYEEEEPKGKGKGEEEDEEEIDQKDAKESGKNNDEDDQVSLEEDFSVMTEMPTTSPKRSFEKSHKKGTKLVQDTPMSSPTPSSYKSTKKTKSRSRRMSRLNSFQDASSPPPYYTNKEELGPPPYYTSEEELGPPPYFTSEDAPSATDTPVVQPTLAPTVATPPPTTAPVITTSSPTTISPTTPAPTTARPVTPAPSTASPTTAIPMTPAPTTKEPTPFPTPRPTTKAPTPRPTAPPTKSPTTPPTPKPTIPPTPRPTTPPTPRPTPRPTPNPTNPPTTAAPAPTLNYNIELSFADNVPSNLRADMRTAARRIESIVVGDLPDQANVQIPDDDEYQFCSETVIDIDDMWLCGQLGQFPDFVDGRGGFDMARFSDDYRYIPYVGYIVISDAVAVPPLNVLIHEMLHAIGFATIWDLLDLNSASPPCDYARANQATIEYQAISGCTGQIPINEPDCQHWDETCFVHEIMTPSYFIDLQGNIPYSFSRITAGSLADLGYTVNLDAADPYTADDMDPSCVCSARSSSSRVGATPLPPPMSDELKKKATEYGQSILRKKHENRRRRLKEMPSLKDKEKGDGVEYVGDRIMFLLLRENNIQYSMIVTQTYDD